MWFDTRSIRTESKTTSDVLLTGQSLQTHHEVDTRKGVSYILQCHHLKPDHDAIHVVDLMSAGVNVIRIRVGASYALKRPYLQQACCALLQKERVIVGKNFPQQPKAVKNDEHIMSLTQQGLRPLQETACEPLTAMLCTKGRQNAFQKGAESDFLRKWRSKRRE